MLMKLICRPVDSVTWADLESLFEDRGGPCYCGYMLWRKGIASADRADKIKKKAVLMEYVQRGTPVGPKVGKRRYCMIKSLDSHSRS
jgi:hypothetical protein